MSVTRSSHPCPRVALCGFDDDFTRQLADVFPTIYAVASLQVLPTVASPVELDLIVSAKASKLTTHPPYDDRCHIILFGESPWHPSDKPHGHRILGQGRSNEMNIAMRDGELGKLLRDAFPPDYSALQRPCIQIFRHGSWVAPDKELWLAWAADPELPLAVEGSFGGKGFAWFPGEVSPGLQVRLVKALARKWAELDPAAFAAVPRWFEDDRWRTNEEISAIAKLRDLESAHAEQLKQYEQSRSQLEREIETRAEEANRRSRAILTQNDELLVVAVEHVLKDLGFQTQLIDNSLNDEKAKEADIYIKDPVDTTIDAVVEVKGFSKRSASANDLARIERHVRRFEKRTGREPSHKLYICNGQYKLSPNTRNALFRADIETARDFYEDSIPGSIVSTRWLFELHKSRTETDPAELRARLLAPGIHDLDD